MSNEPDGLDPPINVNGGQAPLNQWGEVALRPKDGYHAEAFHSDVDNVLYLYVTFTVAGEFKHKTEVTAWTNPSPKDMAECARYELLLDAFCRFFNTGGHINDSNYLVMRIRCMFKNKELGTLEIPGFELLNTIQSGDPVYEHYLYNEKTNEAIEWRENEYVDLMSGQEMEERLRGENEEDEAFEEDLLYQADIESADGDERDSTPRLPT